MQSKGGGVQPICTVCNFQKNFMPPTKNALLRYAAIDACLQRTTQTWSFERLRQQVAETLTEHVDSAGSVSIRTLRDDLKNMRPGGATGYDAPILFESERGYYYSEVNYSIFNSPITVNDLPALQQAFGVLQQLVGLGLSHELGGIVERLELRLSGQMQDAQGVICQFEQPTSYQGQGWLEPLYIAVQQKQVQRLLYQPFGTSQPVELLVHPYLLKQYNGRWFLIAQRDKWEEALSIFALDRIQHIAKADLSFIQHEGEVSQFFTNLIGVSILPEAELAEIRLRFAAKRLPYVLTKPLHASQRVDDETGEVTLYLVPTRELVSLLLSYGGDVEVVAPLVLRDNIKQEATRMLHYYL